MSNQAAVEEGAGRRTDSSVGVDLQQGKAVESDEMVESASASVQLVHSFPFLPPAVCQGPETRGRM
eukprot:16338743-Heterocapsa_arctica.AAC.1